MNEKDQDSWKRKYRALALELEQTQVRNQQHEAQLKHLLAMMTIPLKGTDPLLDKELLSLRKALQADAMAELRGIGDGIQHKIRQLDSQREKHAKAVLASILEWLQQLRQLGKDQSGESLVEFEQRGHDAVEQSWQLADLMSDIVDYQQPLLHSAASNVAPANDLSTEALEGDSELLLKRINVELVAILENLVVPLSARRQLHEVGGMLEQGVSADQLPVVLQSISALAKAACSDSSKEFEVYLRSLSSKLVEVQRFLFENQQEEDEAGASQRRLETQVRTDVSKLSATVDATHDIGDLKHAVSEQLVGIVRVMDELRKQEESRDSNLKQRYGSLIKKVEQMEAETQKVKVHMEEERHRARTDPLTGLPNRVAYDEYIVQELERWQRYEQGFSLAVADLDHFKRINDGYGHLAGDKVLRLVGRILRQHCRRSDVVARYGGEEFVIIMPGTSTQAAKVAVEKLRLAIEDSPFNFYGKRVNVTMSFGVSQVQKSDDLDKLFARADKALYAAKQNGRNQTVAA